MGFLPGDVFRNKEKKKFEIIEFRYDDSSYFRSSSTSETCLCGDRYQLNVAWWKAAKVGVFDDYDDASMPN